jgi:hypothetical protein
MPAKYQIMNKRGRVRDKKKTLIYLFLNLSTNPYSVYHLELHAHRGAPVDLEYNNFTRQKQMTIVIINKE